MTLSRHQWAMSSSLDHYTVKYLPKKDGSVRKVYVPSPPLRAIQRMILDEHLSTVPVHPRAMAYMKGLNTLHMALHHSRSIAILHLDIKDFFPSIGYRRIVKCLDGVGLSNAGAIAGICTVWEDGDRILPQGSITAPTLSNIVAYKLDRRLYAYSLLHRFQYTRYADDIILSSELTGMFTDRIINRCHEIMADEGFTPNKSKTRNVVRPIHKAIVGVSL